MSDPLRTVWDALERAECRPNGAGHDFHAFCPGHDSNNRRSLHVSVGADGRALLHCYVRCDAETIVRAMGLAWADLFPEGHRHARNATALCRKQQQPIDLTLSALIKLGITYRATRNVDMWVAESCPACGVGERYPLWIHRDDRGRLNLSCFNGCPPHQILHALAEAEGALAA